MVMVLSKLNEKITSREREVDISNLTSFLSLFLVLAQNLAHGFTGKEANLPGTAKVDNGDTSPGRSSPRFKFKGYIHNMYAFSTVA